ncbi:MAG: YaeQ family protein [Bdellovibrionales bacterium]|nr:YaeQ family protein [Bdellovibrionales bacterium]
MAPSAEIFSINYSISHGDHGEHFEVRVKTALHHEETTEHLMARFIAFALEYRDGLEFTLGLFDPDEPSMIARNVIGETETWIDIGAVDPKKLRRSLASAPKAKHVVYFYQADDRDHFVHHLKGNRISRLDEVQFYQLDPQFVGAMGHSLLRNSDLVVTSVDHTLYANFNGTAFESVFPEVDIIGALFTARHFKD